MDLNTVIERLEALRDEYTETVQIDPDVYADSQTITAALSHLKAQQWVSVEERLPRPHQRVLVVHESGVKNIRRHAESVPGDFGDGSPVTHWMPLPPPPGDQT